MSVKIKNWARFQHFKDRKPPWIKLYRDLLDDIIWHELDAEAAKFLVMLWLIASESDGVLPSFKELAFRLRVSEKTIKSNVSKLNHWLEHDDITPISDISQISGGYQDDISMKALARSRETETETETENAFARFWNAWPKSDRKGGREKCFEKWKKLNLNGQAEAVIAHVERMKLSRSWTENDGAYIPAPIAYLNGKKWDGAEMQDQNDWREGLI
jgi:hypothetical protein